MTSVMYPNASGPMCISIQDISSQTDLHFQLHAGCFLQNKNVSSLKPPLRQQFPIYLLPLILKFF